MFNDIDSQLMIMELYQRGVTIRDIFGAYYEIEAANDGRSLTVEDAELSGYNQSSNFKPEEGF